MVNGTSDPGVTDMVTISNIDEHVINKNLKKRYTANRIYVSVMLLTVFKIESNFTSHNTLKPELCVLKHIKQRPYIISSTINCLQVQILTKKNILMTPNCFYQVCGS